MRPGLRRIVERDEAEEHAEAHQREGRGETHHDDDDDERQHQTGRVRDRSCVARLRPFRADAPFRRSRAAPSIAILRDSSSTYSLCASCSSMTSISATSFSRLGHSPVLQADHAAHDLGDALQHDQRAGDRDHRS